MNYKRDATKLEPQFSDNRPVRNSSKTFKKWVLLYKNQSLCGERITYIKIYFMANRTGKRITSNFSPTN